MVQQLVQKRYHKGKSLCIEINELVFYIFSQSQAAQLQETELSVLEPAECTHFGKSLEASSSIEICTGRKNKFPLIHEYIRKVNKVGNRVWFQKKGIVKNLLGTNKKEYDFYLGGTDSCQGKMESLISHEPEVFLA